MRTLLNNQVLCRAVATTMLAVACQTTAGADGTDSSSSKVEPSVTAGSAIDAGRYIVAIGGCNDCHTPNWAETEGKVPEEEWLTGIPMGWRGPWGTTYASNLRRVAHELTEDAWVALLKSRVARPPMPWMNVNRMSEADARAVYRFIRSLGMRGERMPAAVEPGAEPQTPYILFEPIEGPRIVAERSAATTEE